MSGHIPTTIRHLITHGWISLRSMSALLGYSHATGIYGRQRGKKAIPVVKIGGTYRVYKDDVINELNNVPEDDRLAAETFFALYRKYLREQKKDE